MSHRTERFLPDINSGRYANMQQLIQLRWIAALGQLFTITFSHFIFMIGLPIREMLEVVGVLIGFNLFSTFYWRVQRSGKSREVTNDHLLLSLIADVILLTALLYFSGGASNPFSSLYLLQIVLGAVILESRSLWALMMISSVCYGMLTITYKPLALLPGSLPDRYVQGMLVCYVINAVLLTLFITHINRKQRERDAHLSNLKQRATEEEHIVRMGLLASGAAHELSTPLSTMAVILGDWQRMPTVKKSTDLSDDVAEMHRQVSRCKTIVTGILLSAGEARGEALEETTVVTFLNELVTEWQSTRKPASFIYENEFGHDLPIISDSVLKQTICNVLDNALEASPQWVKLTVTKSTDALSLSVTDQGPGFPPDMLSHIGKPYQSTKGRSGSGLGLFLVVNVIRTLGGTVAARNNEHGGAVVTLNLPLEALKLNKQNESDNDHRFTPDTDGRSTSETFNR